MNLLRLDGGAGDLDRMVAHFPSGTKLVRVNARERRVFFDNNIFCGSASSFELSAGLHMTVSEFHGHEPVAFVVEQSPMELEFSFCKGQGMKATGPQGEDISVRPGEFKVCSVREKTRVNLSSSDGSADQSIRLNLSAQSICDLLGTPEPPPELSEILNGGSAYSTQDCSLDSGVEAVVDSMLEAMNSSTRGRSLYLQGKGLELVALASDRLAAQDEETPLPEEQVQRLKRAKEILVARLEAPPSVSELAKTIHMGERQFKAGFKSLFGAPVMTYARTIRLERARKLLAARRHNVTEVAQLIGYANPSKFAAAYRRQFGISPRATCA